MDTTTRFDIYRKLRAGAHPLLPRPVRDIAHEYRRATNGMADAWAAARAAWRLDFDYHSNVGRYGGHVGLVSDLTLDAADVAARGFDPEHLTARVEATVDEWYDTVEASVRDMGYRIDPAARHDEHEGRPSHEAVRVGFHGYRDRADYRWISIDPREERHHYNGPAWHGMGRGVRAQVRHEVLLAAAESIAEYVSDVFDDTVQPYCVTVTVYWRGEEVGSASIGGCECRGEADEIAAFIHDDDLVGEALREAERWADAAVRDAQARAAAIVESIALLPERSIEAVRSTYRTATVTPIRKEA
jgi:hypothetical protein